MSIALTNRVTALEEKLEQSLARIEALEARRAPADRRPYFRDYMRQRRAKMRANIIE